MAHLPVIPDVFRCTLNWARSSQHAANVIHILDGVGDKDEADIYASLNANVTSGMWESVVGEVTEVSIIKLDGTSPTLGFATGVTAQWTGEATGEMVPGLACLIKLATAKRGRSYRGRVYLPFTGESKNNDGFLPGGAEDDITGEWVTFANTMATNDVPLVIASYKHATADQVVNLKCERALGTQRRRQSRNR